MNSDYKGASIFGIIIAIILLVSSSICAFTTTGIEINTPQDEIKIREAAKERCVINQQRSYDSHRSDIIGESYTKREVIGFNDTSAKILAILSGGVASVSLVFFFCAIYDDSGIKGYFNARSEYWKSRRKRESETLDKLIELQEKIAGGKIE